MGRGARGWRSVPSKSPFTPSKGIHTPALCAPQRRVPAGGRSGQGGRPFPPHPVLSGPAQGPSFPMPGPLSLKGACPAARERTGICTIPEAGLGGLGPSQDPAFVFLSKKNNNRGSDGAKDCPESRGERRPQPPPGGAVRGLRRGGRGGPGRERGGEGRRGPGASGRPAGWRAARGPHRGSSKRTKAKGTRPCRFLSSMSRMRPYL